MNLSSKSSSVAGFRRGAADTVVPEHLPMLAVKRTERCLCLWRADTGLHVRIIVIPTSASERPRREVHATGATDWTHSMTLRSGLTGQDAAVHLLDDRRGGWVRL